MLGIQSLASTPPTEMLKLYAHDRFSIVAIECSTMLSAPVTRHDAAARKVSDWPKKYRLAHAFLWGKQL